MSPTLKDPVWQLCTHSQFYSDELKFWMGELKIDTRLIRKRWEYAYILRVLDIHNCLEPGTKALGFGVGLEYLPCYFASRGIQVTATDLWSRHWSYKMASVIDDLHHDRYCDLETLRKNAEFKSVDMNDVGEDLVDYDFIWSTGSLEHLGSGPKGLDFIVNSLACLKSGGISVHTTEFNAYSNTSTIDEPHLYAYTRLDIEQFRDRLNSLGYPIEIDWDSGSHEVDKIFAHPQGEPRLKIGIRGHAIVPLGLYLVKK